MGPTDRADRSRICSGIYVPTRKTRSTVTTVIHQRDGYNEMRFGEFGSMEDDLSDQIICGGHNKGDIIHCAEIQPMELIESNCYERFDFDEYLFANYSRDWWLGVLYQAARRGPLGSGARQNVTETGDAILEGYQLQRQNRVGAYRLLRQMARIALGTDEHEAEIEAFSRIRDVYWTFDEERR